MRLSRVRVTPGRYFLPAIRPDIDKMIEAQSREGDPAKGKQILWAIERKLAEDDVRPIIFYRRGGTCERPYVKVLTITVNSIFNSWRMEDVWLDK